MYLCNKWWADPFLLLLLTTKIITLTIFFIMYWGCKTLLRSTQPGSYRFVLGDNLHTDDEVFISVLKINYRHRIGPLPCAP